MVVNPSPMVYLNPGTIRLRSRRATTRLIDEYRLAELLEQRLGPPQLYCLPPGVRSIVVPRSRDGSNRIALSGLAVALATLLYMVSGFTAQPAQAPPSPPVAIVVPQPATPTVSPTVAPPSPTPTRAATSLPTSTLVPLPTA